MAIAIHWFRQDLRLSDNPALASAAERGEALPVYILDDVNAGEHAMGGASRWWLHHALYALDESLGGNLSVYKGDPIDVLSDIIARNEVEAVYWNRCYEPWRISRDTKIKERLKSKGIEVTTANGSLLWEPWTIKKGDGSPYKVFTPFYRKGCLNAEPPRRPLPPPGHINYRRDERALDIDELKLLPDVRWDAGLEPHWKVGEAEAQARLRTFIDEGLEHYSGGRDLPAKPYISRLSPYLHFGNISPNQLWDAVRQIGDDGNIERFCTELGWREFSYSLLYHNPNLPTQNLQAKFNAFPWARDEAALKAWQKGQTGVPMVDAGMRELWQTGHMHNRVRMIAGSFLVKNLLLHWRHGERWFWDTLVDADLANNSAGWQWVAGCGADAAPYFRIFNPVTQGQKFDPDGHYIRRFIPEIAALSNKHLFSPWQAPESILREAGVELGSTYPNPIVDIKASRQRALDSFKLIRQGN